MMYVNLLVRSVLVCKGVAPYTYTYNLAGILIACVAHPSNSRRRNTQTHTLTGEWKCGTTSGSVQNREEGGEIIKGKKEYSLDTVIKYLGTTKDQMLEDGSNDSRKPFRY